MREFWQVCVDQLSEGIPASNVKLWISPLVPIGFNTDETAFLIAAPSPIKLNWAQTNYRDKIQACLKSYFHKDIDVVFQLRRADKLATNSQSVSTSSASSPSMNAIPNIANAANAVATGSVTHLSAQPSAQGGSAASTAGQGMPFAMMGAALAQKTGREVSNEGGITVEIDYDGAASEMEQGSASDLATPPMVDNSAFVPAHLRDAYAQTFINPVQTFDNLVVGRSNELAEASARHVVSHSGQAGYNPLFIYGSTGLGKTHLMHAIGNALLHKTPGLKARYIHAETYYQDMVRCMRNNTWNAVNEQYATLDLLLIDDIQFFRRRVQTQEQFFYLFESMVAKNRQLVISSDTYPRELADINERLISRFSQGLTMQIEPPAFEMRVAILMRKAEEKGLVELNEDVAFFMAKHIRSNVRELEGALQRVTAYAIFKGLKIITLDTCKEALRDLLRVANGLITVENIQKTVADFYKIRVQDMHSRTRRANIALPRQIAMYLSKELTRKSLPDLGDSFGGRDHTTVLHAVRKIAMARASDRQLNHDLHVLEQTLKG
ncbi:MAG: chromosomal replication initiator protein DnaA [Pelistega sp.]|nr:chromosomal replication initiator protein DnaA [Pelistega sp.]